jgi:hypothetical protein
VTLSNGSPAQTGLNNLTEDLGGRQFMARKKSPEDLEWEHIFSALEFDQEPHPKYIKQAVIRTKTGKRFRLNGEEFITVMEQERNMHPDHAVVESCKITLDYEKIRTDVNKFAVSSLNKVSRLHPKSKIQRQQSRKLASRARPQPPTNTD